MVRAKTKRHLRKRKGVKIHCFEQPIPAMTWAHFFFDKCILYLIISGLFWFVPWDSRLSCSFISSSFWLIQIIPGSRNNLGEKRKGKEKKFKHVFNNILFCSFYHLLLSFFLPLNMVSNATYTATTSTGKLLQHPVTSNSSSKHSLNALICSLTAISLSFALIVSESSYPITYVLHKKRETPGQAT